MARVHTRLTGFAILAGILLLIVTAPRLLSASQAQAQAQAGAGPPSIPEIPLVLYGNATGAPTGAGVTALVKDGNTTVKCGAGLVMNDGAQKVYAVQVAADSHIEGCGKSGRTITLYVSPAASFSGDGGKMANQTISWTSAPTSQNNLTFGSAFTVRGFVPLATSDGIN